MKLRVCLALTTILALLGSGALLAQTASPIAGAEAGIRGYGAIKTANGTIGNFAICVTSQGGRVSGYFWYREYANNTTKPPVTIYSKEVTSLEVRGNRAFVKATGAFNNQRADLTFEGLDDNPSGDWAKVTAAPQGMLPYIWGAAGGVIKGDIQIWSVSPVVSAYGHGYIQVANTRTGNVAPPLGSFTFKARPLPLDQNDTRRGYLTYAEVAATPVSATNREYVRINVPDFSDVSFNGYTVKMSGKGAINGKECMVIAYAEDRSVLTSPTPNPDIFSIEVYTADTNLPVYAAKGPVVKGDIVVTRE